MELSQIKGIKEKRLQQLRSVGINTPMDLLSYFPTRYVDLCNLTDFSSVMEGDEVVFVCVFPQKPKTSYVKKSLTITKIKFEIEGKNVFCTWFNQKYIASNVLVGVQYYVIGRAKLNGKSIDVINPKLVRKDTCKSRILTFYKPIKAISSSVIDKAISEVLRSVTIHSFIPDEQVKKYGLMGLNSAYKAIHQPTDLNALDSAKKSVSIEYLSYTLSLYSIIKQQSKVEKQHKYKDFKLKIKQFIDNLPFELTADQLSAVRDIITDMHGSISMNRLVQGDVGCGKTVVALIAAYYAYLSDFQSVIMCPTELLAKQHYQTALSFLSCYGVKVAMLSSSMKVSERREIAFKIASGDIDVVVGTHAVFSQDVQFNRLALVVTDEQHRFGVNQRSSLENKSVGADCLVMSATPIPRTLALTLYGDLKQSYIRTVPKNKAGVSTKILPDYKIDDMWKYFLTCADEDKRTFVVCPRIEDEEDGLVSVKALFKEKKHLSDKIAVLHGQMSEQEKNKIMTGFACGEIKILISTTVIEVGIDVPEAVNIAVYNADRYGLSQLHQLRGRVGRGDQKGYCFLIPGESCTAQARERLEFLVGCSDGFNLAEYDFEIRGAGDFLGSSQHGKNGDFTINAQNIAISKQISDVLLSDGQIKSEIVSSINQNKYAYFRNITLN